MGVWGSLSTLVDNWTNSGSVGWGCGLGVVSGGPGVSSGFIVQGESRMRPPPL